MNLRDTQALFWRAITWPTGVDDFLAQADPATREAFASAFAQSPGFSRTQRMEVYADAYFWRLYEVVVDQYPVTAWLAGAAAFHDLVTDFVLRCPSRTPDVRRFAAGLPDLLRTHRLEGVEPGLADVATVDWAISDAIDRPDERRCDASTLRSIPASAWPGLRLQLTGTATLLDCALPYSALRRAWAADADPPRPLQRSHATVLVWRQADHDVYQRTPDPAEARAVAALLRDETFGAACVAAAGPTGDEASGPDVARWLQRWVDDELVVAYSSSP